MTRTRRNKFKPGLPFSTTAEVVLWIIRGGWVYWHGRPKHPSFMEQLSIALLRQLVRYGKLAQAIKNVEGEQP